MSKLKSKQRVYQKVRNFAEHRCIKIAHSFTGNFEHSDEFHDMLTRIDGFVAGRWTWSEKNFFFENEDDAVMCRLVTE